MKTYYRNAKSILSLVTLCTVLSFSLAIHIPQAYAADKTFSVNSALDTSDNNIGDGICDDGNGNCTLRSAIQEANAGSTTVDIVFSIPGSGTHTIFIGGGFPNIKDNEVHINGYSQPGSVENTAIAPLPLNGTLTIQLDFSQGNSEFVIENSDNTSIRGLNITGAPTTQIYINDSNNVSLSGNYFGTDITGMILTPYDNAHAQIHTSQTVTNLILGGTNPQDRNVFSTRPLTLTGDNSHIYGNYFGLGKDGLTPISQHANLGANTILIDGDNNYVGGTGLGQLNVISGNNIANIVVRGNNNIIQGNYIGGDYSGHANSNIVNGAGVSVVGSANGNLVGGTSLEQGNILRGLSGVAIGVLSIDIELYGITLLPQNNAILGNAIDSVKPFDYLGFGDTNLGIDLFNGIYHGAPNGAPEEFIDQGPNPNDLGDVDNGANGYINTPELNSAVQTNNNLSVDYDLDVIGSDTNQYRVEFFASDTSTIFGYGPGQIFLGSDVVSPGTNIVSTITLNNNLDVTNKHLSATVTPIDSSTSSGFGGTSEFSQNIQIGSPSDFDADGILDEIEQSGPNGGDANNDGIADYKQRTVSTYKIGSTYVSFVTTGCAANGSVASLSQSNLPSTDANYDYPFGLTDFTLNCSVGDSANVTKYVFTNRSADGFIVRKYLPTMNTFTNVQNSTVNTSTIGGQPVIVMNYSLTDGGIYDDDGIANGVIVDPVGLAEVHVASQNVTNDNPKVDNNLTANSNTHQNNNKQNGTQSKKANGVLSYTGLNQLKIQLSAAFMIIVSGLILVISKRRISSTRR